MTITLKLSNFGYFILTYLFGELAILSAIILYFLSLIQLTDCIVQCIVGTGLMFITLLSNVNVLFFNKLEETEENY